MIESVRQLWLNWSSNAPLTSLLLAFVCASLTCAALVRSVWGAGAQNERTANFIIALFPPSVILRQQQLLNAAGIDARIKVSAWLTFRVALILCIGFVVLGIATSMPQLQGASWLLLLAVASIAGLLPGYWLARSGRRRQRALLGQLPFFLDLWVVCLQAGLNLSASIEQSLLLGPGGAFSNELARVPSDLRAGSTLADALRALVKRSALVPLESVASSMIASQTTGSDLAIMLRAQAEQLREQQAFEAEHDAMRAPVKLLAPLLICIFPCTFLVLFFPIAVRMANAGFF